MLRDIAGRSVLILVWCFHSGKTLDYWTGPVSGHLS